ncbi:MAG: NeuD/PglB/VioB family sugar acetyltransferase [Actinomycetia bacterium]|nr:NeuD/PglB/VioB family sugar acetyltransferase [Actinomycetes bacterium]
MGERKVVVVGASGFGRECLDVLEALIATGEPIQVLGVIDDSPSEVNLQRLRARDVAHLGGVGEWLAAPPAGAEYVLGIGAPAVRRRLVAQFDAAGIAAFTAVHPHAVIGSAFTALDGAVVCGGASIGTNVRLGRHVHINPNATIGHDATLADFVSINPAAIVSGEVVVDEATLVGAGATVLQQLRVGAECILGAGTVLTKTAPDGAIVVGVPGTWG